MKSGVTYNVPQFLGILIPPFKFEMTNLLQACNLALLKTALREENSEAYNRIVIDYLIVACMVKHREILSDKVFSSNDQNEQTTPSIATQHTGQSLPMKVFPETRLLVQAEKDGKAWLASGIIDWAMGYGKQLEDGTLLLAIEYKRSKNLFDPDVQLLALLAIVRQLRIQAGKENVQVQGFYSNGTMFRFMCIHNDGIVIKSNIYDLSWTGELKTVFNFLLGMLVTAAQSSPNTTYTIPSPPRDRGL